jgi:molybdopterin/thiamine biosynthesis adenylyltransferase
MIELVLAEGDVAVLKADLLGGQTERCAILYTSQTSRADSTVRLLAREIQFPSAEDYTRKGAFEAELKPELVARITKRARTQKCALVFVHSHPGPSPPRFSAVDDAGERHLAVFFAHRYPDVIHAALVVSDGGLRARRLGSDEEIRVIAIGVNLDVLFDPFSQKQPVAEIHDRQVRAFGKAGQDAITRLRIAVVGLGGTGSVIAQQLVHLGVKDFILVDPDTLEESNLNRVANATARDIGKPKVKTAARYIKSVSKSANVQMIQGDVIQVKTARKLLNADLIFGCTDSQGSRAVLQQVAYQYMIPCLDMGVTIAVGESQITHIFGRVQLLAPGLACFTCDGLLNADDVRRDMMTKFERQTDPYVQGVPVPAPAVMSLNSTVASLAITMMLSMVTAVPVKARHVLYNALASTLRTVRATPQENCYICSRSGAYARGDSWPLFARQR